MVEHILLKNMCRLNLLNIIYIFVFDDEAALENAKLTILEQLEWQIFFSASKGNS